MQQEARKIDFFEPQGGRQKCVCGMWASMLHTHFNMVITRGFIPECTLDCPSENPPTKRPVAFYPKGVAMLDILRLEVRATKH